MGTNLNRKIHVNTRKNIFTMRVFRYWDKLYAFPHLAVCQTISAHRMSAGEHPTPSSEPWAQAPAPTL